MDARTRSVSSIENPTINWPYIACHNSASLAFVAISGREKKRKMLANRTPSVFSVNAREFSNDRHSQDRGSPTCRVFMPRHRFEFVRSSSSAFVVAVETKATDVRCADARSDRLLVDSGKFFTVSRMNVSYELPHFQLLVLQRWFLTERDVDFCRKVLV